MPALADWHVVHELASGAAEGSAIPAHARIEAYSVLTRMPPPLRLDNAVAGEAVARAFPPERTLIPSRELAHALVARCAEHGIAGGSVYDALVALTAAEAGATLLSRDRRAASTYDRLDVEYELLD